MAIHYSRPDGEYAGWGLHLWGDAIADGVGTSWGSPRPFDGIDAFGAYWVVPIKDATLPVNFIIHNGDVKDPGPDQSIVPQVNPAAFVKSQDATLYPQLCAAEGNAVIHYRRAAGDYGDYTSTDYKQFWGLHTWNAAADPGWTTPHKPQRVDGFGVVFSVPVDQTKDLGYILHKGDTKDPGSDQFLTFKKYGCEVWQLEGADPEALTFCR
ncbi:MAG: hypothetical protein IPK16_17400 [Anaerolineales bacterium]|nr:hypothetical protein [Anaerolineales bacterium]